VALRADFEYVLVEFQRDGVARRVILAAGLAAASLQRYTDEASAAGAREVARFEGKVLEGLKLQHPFQDRRVPVILGDHVTLEAGTGAVHTAPAHGQTTTSSVAATTAVVNPVL
jgi:isoleucyl-tRNA synthetase